MAITTTSLLQAARKAALASRAAAAAASRATLAADAAAGPAALYLAATGTEATSLLRAARKAAAASRAAAAAASRAARAADVAARSSSVPMFYPVRFPTNPDAYDHLPEDSTTPTDKDFESDAALWALYERWCKAFDKKRDHYDMVCRFKIFRYHAEDVHRRNTHLPPDPKEAAIFKRKRRKVKSLLSKGKSVSHYDDCYLPVILGPLADGGDPFLRQRDYDLLKSLEKRDAAPCS